MQIFSTIKICHFSGSITVLTPKNSQSKASEVALVVLTTDRRPCEYNTSHCEFMKRVQSREEKPK